MARHRLGRAKKRAQDRQRTLIFLDEAAFEPTPIVVAMWAPEGERPVLVHNQGHRDKVAAISAVTSTRMLYFRLKEEEAFNGPDFAAFVRLLLRHVRRRIVLVMDNAKQHHAKIVTGLTTRHRRLRIEFLPGYSPDFNPDEGVWDHTKVVDLGNYRPKNTEDLVTTARRVLKNLKRRPDKVTEFWRETNLPLEGLELCLNLPEAG